MSLELSDRLALASQWLQSYNSLTTKKSNAQTIHLCSSCTVQGYLSYGIDNGPCLPCYISPQHSEYWECQSSWCQVYGSKMCLHHVLLFQQSYLSFEQCSIMTLFLYSTTYVWLQILMDTYRHVFCSAQGPGLHQKHRRLIRMQACISTPIIR